MLFFTLLKTFWRKRKKNPNYIWNKSIKEELLNFFGVIRSQRPDSNFRLNSLYSLIRGNKFEDAQNASSGQEAILKLRENEVDLLFLDIEMGDMTGMDLAAYLKTEQIDLALIFVTGHPGFALEGYAYQPIDYLMKPIDFLRLERAVRTTKERIQKDQKPKVSDSRIGIKSENGIRILEVKSILFIEKKGRKAILNLKNGENGENVLSSNSMKSLEEIFLPFEFYRAHQSFLVSLSHIVVIYPAEIARSYTIEITSGKKIPLSRHKFANLKELLEEKGILLL